MLNTAFRGRPLERCATSVIQRAGTQATREVTRLAVSLALFRKKRAMLASARPITPRALTQWRRTNLVDDVDGIVVAAVRRVAHFVPKDSADFLRSVAASIRDELAREKRSRGRPKKATGLLASSSSPGSAKRGRPRAMAETEERAWAKRVLRMQIKLFGEKNFLRVERALVHLQEHPENLSDVAATKAIAKVERGPQGSTTALARRYQRALTTFRLWPPTPKKK